MKMGLIMVVAAMLCAGAAAQSSCVNMLVLNGAGSSLGININQTQALALPAACKVQTPPTTQCNAASPASTPVGTGTLADTPADSPNSVPSGTGSKTIPTTENGSSAGSSIKLSIPLLLIMAATYVSTY
ncbi:hypothetical protein Lal_00007728 [Lupinus albus]|nr:hypothetical protein Lal_00007728 [Lupinus albus]